jgi:hypothetical protein
MPSIAPIYRLRTVPNSMNAVTFNSEPFSMQGNRVVLAVTCVSIGGGGSFTATIQGSMDGTTWVPWNPPTVVTLTAVGYGEQTFSGVSYPLIRFQGTLSTGNVIFDASFAFSSQ